MNWRVTHPPAAGHQPPTSTSRRQRLGFGITALGLAASSLAFVGLTGSPAQAAPSLPACVAAGDTVDCTITYGFTGDEEEFTVPAGIDSLDVTVVGAYGGGWAGRGAVVTAGLAVSPADSFFVEVGGQGGWGSSFNGGGYSGVGLGGGGATDVRTVSASGDPADSLASRLLVAGGGGGGGDGRAGSPYNGGDSSLDGATGGHAQFSTGWSPGGGGTQTGGGYAGGGAPCCGPGGWGALGAGGGGGDFNGYHGGGGGGGFFGGGGGGIFNGGGGGSSLVPTDGTVRVNDAGLPAQAAFTYGRPVTGMLAVSGDPSTTAGTPVTYRVTVTDGLETAEGSAASLAIFPDGAGTGASCTTTSCAATKAGTYQVTATSNGFQKTTTLTVEAGPLAATSLTPATGTVEAGTGVPFTVSGVDAFDNPVSVPDGSSTIEVTPAGGGESVPCTAQTCTVNLAGDYVVSSSTPKPGGGTLSAVATMSVVAGPVASLDVSPDGASTPAGTSVTFSAEARDSFGNLIADQHVDFSYASGGHDVGCPDGTCSPTSTGAYTVTASALPGGGQPAVTQDVALTVSPAGVAVLSVTPENKSTPAGTPVQYAVSGVDEYGNTLPDQTATSTVTYTPAGGDTPVVCEDALCGPTAAGLYLVDVTGSGPEAPLGDATTLTVVPADLDATSLEPADLSVTAGDTVSYSVIGVDAYDNELDETGASTITVAPSEGGDPIACPRGVCRVTDAGSYVVTSTTPGPAEGDVVTTTSLEVTPDVLASLKVTPGTAQTRTGVAVTYAVTGSDRFGNDLGDLTADAELTLVPLAGGDPVECDGADCTPYVAGTYRVEVLLDGVSGGASLNALATRTTIAVDPEGDTEGLTFGDDVPVSAAVASPDGPVPSGLVQFSLDGDAVGDPVAVDGDGVAQLPAVEDVDAGSHTLRADFVSEPAGASTLASGQTSFVIARAPTATHVSVSPGSVTAVVSAGALPTPTGHVRFSLNGRDLGSAEPGRRDSSAGDRHDHRARRGGGGRLRRHGQLPALHGVDCAEGPDHHRDGHGREWCRSGGWLVPRSRLGQLHLRGRLGHAHLPRARGPRPRRGRADGDAYRGGRRRRSGDGHGRSGQHRPDGPRRQGVGRPPGRRLQRSGPRGHVRGKRCPLGSRHLHGDHDRRVPGQHAEHRHGGRPGREHDHLHRDLPDAGPVGRQGRAGQGGLAGDHRQVRLPARGEQEASRADRQAGPPR